MDLQKTPDGFVGVMKNMNSGREPGAGREGRKEGEVWGAEEEAGETMTRPDRFEEAAGSESTRSCLCPFAVIHPSTVGGDGDA